MVDGEGAAHPRFLLRARKVESGPPSRFCGCDIGDSDNDIIAPYTAALRGPRSGPARAMEMAMGEIEVPRRRRVARGRPFKKGKSGNPDGRPAGARNHKTLAAAILLEGESEALTRKAVELALAGDPTAMRLCVERVLPSCRERAVKFALPPIESAADIAPAMKAVTAALADGVITPGEGEAIARIVDTFVRAIETSDFERRLKAIEDKHAAEQHGPFAYVR